MKTASPAHCAKFSDALLPVAVDLLKNSAKLGEGARVLDPFAGTGKGVEYLAAAGFNAIGIELEPEFIGSPRVQQGNALRLPFADGTFDAIFTSPTYGNRMADKDMRESVAGTYAKSLGRHASDDSSCHLQWGEAYRAFHAVAWHEARRVLRDDGFFLLNIKDHVRGKELQGVPAWHRKALEILGFKKVRSEFIRTPGVRIGQNSEARADGEWLHLFRSTKPTLVQRERLH